VISAKSKGKAIIISRHSLGIFSLELRELENFIEFQDEFHGFPKKDP
jgi:hypothetical protein